MLLGLIITSILTGLLSAGVSALMLDLGLAWTALAYVMGQFAGFVLVLALGLRSVDTAHGLEPEYYGHKTNPTLS